MNPRLRPALLALFCTAATATAYADLSMPPAFITAAITDPARPVADVASDQDRKPAELLAFAGIKPGDRVADYIPGGGYFTRLFSKAVGVGGHVYAVVPESVDKARPAALDAIRALVADPVYSNTSLAVRPYEDIAVGEPLDMVWTSLNYHDVYGEVSVFAVSGISGQQETARLDAAIFKALKPGGVYIVIDHAASAGATEKDAHALHRIDPAVVIAQTKAAGFVLEAQSQLLANPQDGHDRIVFAPEIKGHTDKFVLKFRKP
jgi:predicted methyltransferase